MHDTISNHSSTIQPQGTGQLLKRASTEHDTIRSVVTRGLKCIHVNNRPTMNFYPLATRTNPPDLWGNTCGENKNGHGLCVIGDVE